MATISEQQLQQRLVDLQTHMSQVMAALQLSQERAVRAETALAQSVSVPGSPPRQRPRDLELVDTKLLTKPRRFSGKEGERSAWTFKMLAYVGALDGEMLAVLTAASSEATVTNMANNRLHLAGQERSRQLYYILILLLEGPALQIVKSVPTGEGCRVWRVLQERCEPAMPSRRAGLLQEIIGYRFSPDQIEAAIAEFEYKVSKYAGLVNNPSGRFTGT